MPATSSSRSHRLVAAAAAVPVVVGGLVLGVWVAGGVITDDYRASMGLTAAWFALAGVACVLVARRSRHLRVAVLATYVLTAGAVGAYLGLTTLRDRVVDEQVVVAAPAPGAATASMSSERAEAPRAVELASGRFASQEHATSGRAAVVRLADGRRFLTLTRFATSAGPDLRVRLAPGDSAHGGADGNVDLGALKGNRGDQQYRVPSGVELDGRTVVVWCRAFSAPFGSAPLQAR